MEAQKKISHEISEWLNIGIRYHQAGRLEEAKGLYNSILEKDSNNADALHLSGLIAHEFGEIERAIVFIKKAIGIDSNQAFFHNNLGNALKDAGDIAEATDSYQKAIQLQPNYAEAHLNLGEALSVQNQLEDAIREYKKVLEIQPDMIGAAFKLGHGHRKMSRLEESIYWYQYIVKRWPENPEGYYFIGAVKLDQEDYDSAIFYLKKVLAINPSHTESHFKLAMIHMKLGNPDEAASCYQTAIKIKPDSAEAYNNLGLIWKDQQRLPEAISCFRKALQLNPALYEGYYNLGNILRKTGKTRESISCFQKALKVKPDYLEALIRLGNCHDSLEDLEESIACYENVIKIDPKCVFAYYAMGLANNKMGNKDDATTCFQKAVELDSDRSEMYSVIYINLRMACNWNLTDMLEKKMDLSINNNQQVDSKTRESSFVSIVRDADPAINFSVARAASHKIVCSLREVNIDFDFSNKRNKKGKKVVAYFSANFGNHAGAQQMYSIFGCHKRKEFEIICYSSGKDDGGFYREIIKRDCDKFIDISEMSDIDAAKQIYHDQVDILVDLTGDLDGRRTGIFALRPAPVQIRYLGMAGTSGADFYDYLVADKIVTPCVDAPFYSEAFINMPHCYMVNSVQLVSKNKNRRADFGLPEQGFVFCSFNSNYKIDRELFHTWMEILVQVPGSVLWLLPFNKAAETNLKMEAKSSGLDSKRVVFTESLEHSRHLARFHLADLVLDTRVVNGAASTCDALRMGLPIITLKGNHFASRMSASILTAMGLPELITHDLKQYKDLAVHLATSEQLEIIRSKVKKNRHSSPLFDTRRFVRNLENAYKQIWDIYIQGREPRQIDVKESAEAN